MKHTPWILAAVAAIAAPRLAHADPPAVEMGETVTSADWRACVLDYRYARSEHVTDDTKVPPLAKKVDTLDAGATPTIKELEAACLAEAKRAPDAADQWHEEVKLYVGGLRNDMKTLASGDSVDYATVHGQAQRCNDVLDYAVQILDPKEKITLGAYGQPDWTGTIEGSREICAAADKVADDAKQKLLGPYTKVGMAGDKLATIAEYIDTYLQIPGGASTNDPKKLKKANVWFVEFTGDDCAAGKITELTRFQFDKHQKLVKTTTRNYCGDPPKSAFR